MVVVDGCCLFELCFYFQHKKQGHLRFAILLNWASYPFALQKANELRWIEGELGPVQFGSPGFFLTIWFL